MRPQFKNIITDMVRKPQVYENWQSIIKWEKEQLIEDGVITPEATEYDIEFELKMEVEVPYNGSTDIGMCVFGARPRYYVIKRQLPQNGDRHIGESYTSWDAWDNQLATFFGEEVIALLTDEGIRAKLVRADKINDDYDAKNFCPAVSKYVILSCKVHITEN